MFEVAQNALGILTTESRKIWSNLRRHLIKSNRSNASSLGVVESALFVVCLDDYETEDLNDLCANFLCGSYELDGGVQVGTCTNRWYDKASTGLPFSFTIRDADHAVANHRVLQRRGWCQL